MRSASSSSALSASSLSLPSRGSASASVNVPCACPRFSQCVGGSASGRNFSTLSLRRPRSGSRRSRSSRKRSRPDPRCRASPRRRRAVLDRAMVDQHHGHVEVAGSFANPADHRSHRVGFVLAHPRRQPPQRVKHDQPGLVALTRRRSRSKSCGSLAPSVRDHRPSCADAGVAEAAGQQPRARSRRLRKGRWSV